MSTSLPQLDLSQSQPIPGAGASELPQLDLSKSVPVGGTSIQSPSQAAPEKPGILDRAIGAAKDWAGGVASQFSPPQDHKEELAGIFGGPQALVAYRSAKALVDGIENTIKAPAKNYGQAKQDFQRGLQDFASKDYRNLASDAASMSADMAGAVSPGTSMITDRARQFSEGARPGGDLVTPTVKTGLDAGAALLLDKVGGSEAEEPEVSQAGPKETTVARNTAKSGISAGTPETTAPTGEDIQPALQQGTRDTINKTLQKNGLQPVPDSVTIRNAADNMSKQFMARSKDAFSRVDQLTNVNPTILKDVMASRADQIETLTASGEMEKAGNLQQLQLRDEEKMAQAFKDAKAADPKADIDQARQDWNSSLRAEELSSAIRGSAEGTLKAPTLNPSKLTPRLQKLTEGRLPELMGDDSATLAEHAENARDATQAIKDFEPQSATGQQALSKIISDNTVEQSSLIKRGKVVAGTNWNGVVRDIGNLTPVEQQAFGPELAQVRQFAGKQALKQNAVSLLKKGVLAGAAGATGLVGYEAAKAAIGR